MDGAGTLAVGAPVGTVSQKNPPAINAVPACGDASTLP